MEYGLAHEQQKDSQSHSTLIGVYLFTRLLLLWKLAQEFLRNQ